MQELYNNLPLYEAKITDDETGVYCLSLVTNPATQVGFVYFEENKEMEKFAIDNPSEHIVSGIIMLADTPIFRRSPSGYEFYLSYSKETLKIMAERMIKDGVGSSVNIQHKDGSNVEGVNLMELYIIDKERGICPSYFSEVPDGSLVGSYKVHNEDVWSMIENGDVLSFSLEGVFSVEEVAMEEKHNKQENTIKMKINRVKEMLRKMLAEFGEVSTDKGVLIYDGNDDLKAGDAVHSIDEEGNDVAVEDGEYRTEDKKIIIVKDGSVEEIKDEEAEVAPIAEEEPIVEEEAKEEEKKEKCEEEEEPKAEEEDEKDARIAELEASIAEKEAKIAELEAKIAELEKEPAAPSAEEAFSKVDAKDDNSAIGKMVKRGYKF